MQSKRDGLLVALDDPRLRWYGAVSLERSGGWVMPWRIPHQDRALFDAGLMLENVARPAGVRLAFRSDTVVLGGQMQRLAVTGMTAPYPGAAALDVRCDGQLIASAALAGRERFRFEGLPAGDKQIELWLPPFAPFRLYALELSEGASLAPAEDARPRWVTYGSSITHGIFPGAHPSETWTAAVAREADLSLTSLGFAGQCHLDPMVARMIRDLPVEYLSAKVAANALGGGTLSRRTFRPALIGFLLTIRDGHPDTPFAVISPILFPAAETVESKGGLTAQAMREEIAAAVETLRARGDRHLHYVDGLRLFGPEHAALLSDGVHPNATGYAQLARNFLQEVVGPLFHARDTSISAAPASAPGHE